MQPTAIILVSIKLNQQVVTFYLQFLARGDTASSKNRNFQSNTQQYAVAEQAIKCYTGTDAKTSKSKTPETNSKVLPNL